MRDSYDNFTFECDGEQFRADLVSDYDADAPWDREDGHGPVSDWTRRDKVPGERELCENRGNKRYYDFQGAIAIAKRDGWGLNDADAAALQKRLGRAATVGDIRAEAVERDFKRLRDWCDNRWAYCGVVVRRLDCDGEPMEERESLWGIESDCREYIEEVARELAAQLPSVEKALARDVAALAQRIHKTIDAHGDNPLLRSIADNMQQAAYQILGG